MLVLTLERLPIVLPKADSQGSVGSDGRLSRELALKGGSGQEEPFEETGSSLLPSLSLPPPRLVKHKQHPSPFICIPGQWGKLPHLQYAGEIPTLHGSDEE